MLKKALIYLGLGPDEEYEQYGEPAAVLETVRPVRDAAVARPSGTVHPVAAPRPDSRPSVRPVAPARGAVVVAQARAASGERPGGSAIKMVEPLAVKPHASSPESFNEAQDIGDRFKSGQPVIINLQGVDRDLRRRLIDFASGLCYALGGKMDKVATHVYMLTPDDVEISAAEARRALD